jgi:hypothetical protein
MSGTLRKSKNKSASNVNSMKMEINKGPVALSFATPRPSNFYRAAKAGNEKGMETMKRATNAQVATTWKKKRGAFCTAKSKGGRRKSKRKRRRKKGGSDPKKDECPICLEKLKGDKSIIDVHKNSDKQEKEKTAGADKHYFHLDCVNQLKRNVAGNKCPTCRQNMNYFERLVGDNKNNNNMDWFGDNNSNNNNNRNSRVPLGRHGQRLASEGAIIAHEQRVAARYNPIAGRRAARERLKAEARSGRGLGGGKRRKTKRKKRRRRKTRRRRTKKRKR